MLHHLLDSAEVFGVLFANFADSLSDVFGWSALRGTDIVQQTWQAVVSGIIGTGGFGSASYADQRHRQAFVFHVSSVLGFDLVRLVVAALEDTQCGLLEAVGLVLHVLIVLISSMTI